VGPFWTVVRTSIGTGMASTMADAGHGGGQPPIRDAGSLEERAPLELAALLRSTSPPEAAVGLAAVNALLGVPARAVTERNAAAVLRERGRGHLVALVGRFPFTDALRATCRELWVFERGTRRRPDELGEEHMDELLPHAELVAVTATSLLNGTLDRIVSLVSRDAFLMLLGPSTPLAQCLLAAGFDVLCGTVVEAPEAVVRAVSQGAVTGQIRGVRRVCLWREM
jgi:uncharacterized protein (DUF4213/DUF364 family)